MTDHTQSIPKQVEEIARGIWEWAFDEEGNMNVTILEFRDHVATALREYGKEIYNKANGSSFLCPACEAPLRPVKRMDGESYWAHPVYECPKVIQEKLNKADVEGVRGE